MHEDYTDRLLHVIDYHIRQATVAYAGQQRLGSLCAHYGDSRTAQGQGYAEGYLVALRRMHRLIRRADSAPPLAIGQLLLLECGKWQRDAEVHRLFSDAHFSDSAYCRGALDAVATITAAAERVAHAEPLLFHVSAPQHRSPAF